MTDPTARALRLLSLLQTYKFWSGEELAAELEVSPRTLRRDVDRLRELGYPVDATPGASGGYRLAAGAHLPPLLLDDDEAVAIAVGLRAAAGASIEGIEETSVRALAKLEQVLPERLRRRVNAVHTNVSSMQRGVDTATVDADALAVLALACRDNEQVRFDYRRRDGDEAQRLVEPHNLVSAGRRWYLVGLDVRREDWRTFRLDRLEAPRLGGVLFRPRELPAQNAAAFVAASIAAMPVPFEATIIATGSDAAVRNLVRYANAKVEAMDDANCRVLIRSDSLAWLVTVAALLATEFEIVIEKPADLVAHVKRLGLRLRAVSTRSAK
jgi:predicted DNA-binding transcriptional regulator YafY